MDLKQPAPSTQDLWLGYDGLLVPFGAISALLVYQPAWDRRIEQTYGRVPQDVRAVVLLADGRMLPARRALADLHARWSAWQSTHTEDASDHEEERTVAPDHQVSDET